MKYIKTYESFNTNDDVDLKEVSQELGKELEKELTPEEAEILADFYKEEGKQKVLDLIQNTEGIKEGFLTTDKQIPEEGEFGMSKKEIQVRSILDRIIKKGAIASLLGIIPAAMAGAPFVAIGLGVAALAGCAMGDAAWWKSTGYDKYQTGHHYAPQNKYGMK